MKSQRSLALIVSCASIALAVLFAVLPVSAHDTHKAKPAAKDAQCEHKAQKSECFICDPKLRDKGRMWCNEHERYEDRCWICHPELQDKKRMFCNAHSLYEDECFLCHPELKKKQDKPSGGKAPSASKDGEAPH